MKNEILNEVKKIAKEFNRKELLIEAMLYSSMKEGYNAYESLQNIKIYFKKLLVQNLSNSINKYRKI